MEDQEKKPEMNTAAADIEKPGASNENFAASESASPAPQPAPEAEAAAPQPVPVVKAVAPQPAPQPVPVVKAVAPQPALQPIPVVKAVAPQPTPQPAPRPVSPGYPQFAPQPTPQPAPRPVSPGYPQFAPQPTPQPASRPVSPGYPQFAPQPTPQPVPQPLFQPKAVSPQPVPRPVSPGYPQSAPQTIPAGYSPVPPQSQVPNGGFRQPGYPGVPQPGTVNGGFQQPGYPGGPQPVQMQQTAIPRKPSVSQQSSGPSFNPCVVVGALLFIGGVIRLIVTFYVFRKQYEAEIGVFFKDLMKELPNIMKDLFTFGILPSGYFPNLGVTVLLFLLCLLFLLISPLFFRRK